MCLKEYRDNRRYMDNSRILREMHQLCWENRRQIKLVFKKYFIFQSNKQ